MVQGITFDKQLLASEDFAHQVNYFYQGKMGVSKGCEISTDVSGDLVVSDGYFSIYGRLLKNVGDAVAEVPSVPSGVLYSSLVFEVDLTKENTIDQFNQGQFKIVSNAVTYPTLVQENLDDGGNIYQLEFARFENTVSGIVNLQDKRTILSMQMYTPQDDFNSHLAEKVHQYEEGVWTPALTFGGGTAGITYGPREGKYTKIGNAVTCYCNITLTSKGTSIGSAELNGLPFPVVGNGSFSVGETFGISLPSGGRDIFGILLASRIGLRSNNISGSTVDLTNEHLGSTSRIRLNITYITQ